MPFPTDKKALREAAFARRDALSEHERGVAARAIAERGLPFTIERRAVIAGYSPIRNEIDPRPLLKTLAGQGAITALPTIAAQNMPLIFRVWREGDAVHRGPLGIMEPSPEAEIVAPDIVLVPMAAFDRRGQRIGYGAGHYDRALGHLWLEKPVIAVGIAFAIQEIADVPAEPHDVPLDYMLTEKEIIDFRS